MLNVVARDLQTEHAVSCFAHFVTRPDVTVDESQDGHSHHSWSAETTVVDAIRNYEVRLSADAWNNILRLIETTRRKRGRLVETGGLLLGERDDSARVIWVTEASDPPPDSRLSRDAFVCGVQGTADLDAQRQAETLGAVRFVGMWHTHPEAPPSPSAVDLNGMRQLVTSIDPPIAEALMVIVGFTPSSPTAAAYLFGREDFAGPGGTGIRLGSKRGWRRWTSRMVVVTSRFIGFRGGNGEQAS
jgi:integrative and conjugative element protein (TIGR02256 family)